jgi:hypothetical protein
VLPDLSQHRHIGGGDQASHATPFSPHSVAMEREVLPRSAFTSTGLATISRNITRGPRPSSVTAPSVFRVQSLGNPSSRTSQTLGRLFIFHFLLSRL